MGASNFLQKYLAVVTKLPPNTSELAKLKYSSQLVTRVFRSIPWNGTIPWDESVKRDLKEWNISKDLAMDRSA
jgi:hypothetical protein